MSKIIVNGIEIETEREKFYHENTTEKEHKNDTNQEHVLNSIEK